MELEKIKQPPYSKIPLQEHFREDPQENNSVRFLNCPPMNVQDICPNFTGQTNEEKNLIEEYSLRSLLAKHRLQTIHFVESTTFEAEISNR